MLGGHRCLTRSMEMLWNEGAVTAAQRWEHTKCHWIKHLQEVKVVNLVLCKCHHSFKKGGPRKMQLS